MKTSLISLSLTLFFGFAATTQAVSFDFAHIGNAGNAADDLGLGAVAYNYAISKTEVTNAQYTEFLNAVAASDPYRLYHTSMGSTSYGGIIRSGSSGNYTYAVKSNAAAVGPGGADYTYAAKPVNYISWYDSVRFINWMNNGQGNGDTETGAYTLLGGTPTPSNGGSVTRNSNAVFWLPSEDEWYKSAYHDATAGIAGTYFDFATGTNTNPDNNLPSADTGNSVNHYDFDFGLTNIHGYPGTDVGAYGLSESPYGTFDQSGNVWEWNDTLVRPSRRGLRGGSWDRSVVDLIALTSSRDGFPSSSSVSDGFRIATVPEPTSIALLCFGALVAMNTSRRNGR